KIDARLKNLEALGLDKLKGSGTFTMQLTGEQAADVSPTLFANWQSLHGPMTATAKNLTLPGLVDKAQVDVKGALRYTPATHILSFNIAEGSYSDSQVTIKDVKTALEITTTPYLGMDGTFN